MASANSAAFNAPKLEARQVFADIGLADWADKSPGWRRLGWLELLRVVREEGFATAAGSHDFVRYLRDWCLRLGAYWRWDGIDWVERRRAQESRVVEALPEEIFSHREPLSADLSLGAWRFLVRETARSARTEAGPLPEPFADDPRFPPLLEHLLRAGRRLKLKVGEMGVLAYGVERGTKVQAAALERRAFRYLPFESESLAKIAGAITDPDPGPFDFENRYLWLRLEVHLAQSEIWADRYRATSRQPRSRLREGLADLRRGRLEDGRTALAEARRDWDEIREQPAVHGVVGRFYYGALSYQHYVKGDLAAATDAMERAREQIGRAVAARPSLLPFAAVGLDIPLKKARLARKARDWDAVACHLGVLRQQVVDEAPLCDGFGGEPPTLRRIRNALAAAPGGRRAHGETLRFLEDRSWRARQFLAWVQRLYVPKDWLCFLG